MRKTKKTPLPKEVIQLMLEIEERKIYRNPRTRKYMEDDPLSYLLHFLKKVRDDLKDGAKMLNTTVDSAIGFVTVEKQEAEWGDEEDEDDE